MIPVLGDRCHTSPAWRANTTATGASNPSWTWRSSPSTSASPPRRSGTVTARTRHRDWDGKLRLVELWLEDLELEGEIAASTRELYERHMRTLVLPVFRGLTLREVGVSRVDRFLKAQAKISYSRAKHSKVVLGLALGLAVRYDAIPPAAGMETTPTSSTAATRTSNGTTTWRRQPPQPNDSPRCSHTPTRTSPQPRRCASPWTSTHR